MTNFSGLSTPPSPPLTGSDIHIHLATLTGSAEQLAYYASLLSREEQERAKRFYFQRDHDRYIFGRGLLRTLLQPHLQMDAKKIPIDYGEHGKPLIRNQRLQFNLAHSNEWAVFCFCLDQEIGIDIEHIRPLQNADDFARQFFTASESAWVQSLPGNEKWNGFYKLWTCKEAYLKANGSGLTVPLNEAEIFIQMDDSATLLSIGTDVNSAAKWRLELFNPLDEYQAALAIKGSSGRIRYYSHA